MEIIIAHDREPLKLQNKLQCGVNGSQEWDTREQVEVALNSKSLLDWNNGISLDIFVERVFVIYSYQNIRKVM